MAKLQGVAKKHVDAIGVTALIANNTVPPVSVRASIIKEEDKALRLTTEIEGVLHPT